VLFPGALGDFICFLPTLETLVRDADVDLFARREFADIVPPGVRVRSLDCREISQLFVAYRCEEQRLRDFFGVYASVYSWLGSQQRGFVQCLDSFSRGKAEIFRLRANDSGTHQIDYYLNCIGRDDAVSCEPAVVLRPEGAAWCADFWRRHRLHVRPVLVIAPGSGTREKNWPEAFFIEVVEWWRKSIRGVAVLLTGPVEDERGGTERLGRSCLVANGLILSQALALLGRCELYLGNDSGITHLAAASGTRTVALFGPSNVRQWSPRGKRVTIVSRSIGCSPCQVSTMKSCPHRACLAELQPTDVIGLIATLPEVVTLTRIGAGTKV
jgi:ADP-heptose:LPS heptosyltransferase